ncbi:hypothetical protein RclHR1_29010001 [Rhizophagus clarus]|uniref:Uncharacterized protein n=1 Tax=Rhizophagus clarus TaxID=94130 RepID=A0A2Z6RIE3_9GLOM|nr:hypothetical protein RclHR1_29010001 [Rhizophagus clarus]
MANKNKVTQFKFIYTGILNVTNIFNYIDSKLWTGLSPNSVLTWTIRLGPVHPYTRTYFTYKIDRLAMVFVKTVVKGKYIVAIFVDTTFLFSTISEEFFDKLVKQPKVQRKYRVVCVSKLVKRYNKDAIGEISNLHL